MTFSLRSQIALMWWGIAFGVIYGVAFGFLLHMVPPPDATMSADEISAWYVSHHESIKVGAVIAGWTGAFLMPIFLVVGAQMRRYENGFPVWSSLTIVSGALTTIFLVLPPVALGAAAYTPGRAADATAMLHEFAILMFVTTDQFYVFAWVAMIVISLRPNAIQHSPFPRWYGYFNIWMLCLAELGVLGFLQRSGVISWKGLFVYWMPFGLFGVWFFMTAVLMLRSLRRQLADFTELPEFTAPELDTTTLPR